MTKPDVDRISRSARFSGFGSLIAALLVTIASIAGTAMPATYARETALWRVQGIGQDWANLLVDVPWLVVSAVFVLRGSRRGCLLLGGALVYTAYSYAMYAFDVHFNALFLVYCAALGTSTYALVALAPNLRDAFAWFDRRARWRFPGGFEMACAIFFAMLWLSQIVPALLRGTSPAGLEATGLITNPVHVLDLALVLPAMFVGGWLLWHRRPLGYAVAPVLLGFTVLMGSALFAMTVAMAIERIATSYAVGAVSVGLVAVAIVALARMLAGMRGVGDIPEDVATG